MRIKFKPYFRTRVEYNNSLTTQPNVGQLTQALVILCGPIEPQEDKEEHKIERTGQDKLTIQSTKLCVTFLSQQILLKIERKMSLLYDKC